MRMLLAATTATFLTCTASLAATVGQPFLVIEDDASGFILDNFFGGIPSGIQSVTLSGTVSQAIGAPALVGADFAFSTSDTGFGPDPALTVAGEDLAPFDRFAEPPLSYLLDPFRIGGPGDLNFLLAIFPPAISIYDPVSDTFTDTYQGDFSGYGSNTYDVATGDNFVEVLMSVYLDGPLPTDVFEEIDPATGAVLSRSPYIDGPLSIDRITLGTVGGTPLPTVPLPASGLLILGAMGCLAALRRRKRPA